MDRGDAERVTATVKWFNRSKGFGFITAIDGSGDIFLPAAVLGLAGHDEVGEGATITCDVVEGPKGRAVTSIVEIDETTGTPRQRSPHADRTPSGSAETLDGMVKWFDIVRGFGFISPQGGGKDVFIHVSVLRRSGLETLTTGQNVRAMVQEARRGLEAISVELA
ncbi:MAG TPA: cold-shock protein [Aliidongia sp.]|nr:cold-shock protein [Aliidongia sp.]